MNAMDRNVTKNYIFRYFTCGLTIEDASKLCLVSATEVKKWDEGKPIPPLCKRVMRMYVGHDLCPSEPEWSDWKMSGKQLVMPNKVALSPHQISTAAYILSMAPVEEHQAATRLLKFARLLANYLR